MPTPDPNKIDRYLHTLPADQRKALQQLRRTIQSAVPRAEEGASYGLPAYILNGRPLAAFSASKHHCSFFPMDGSTVSALAAELKGFDVSKGTIRFTPDKPLPASLIKRIVKARAAAIGGRAAKSEVSQPSSKRRGRT
jgi:uncharacterized protein YdhG (YjbR/CyaY superfamily)